MFKRKKKLDYKLISDPTKSINLDNDDILVSYSIGFFTGITVGGNKCDKESVELTKKLIRLLQERGLEHKVFSSYSIGHLMMLDLDIPMPKVKPPKQEDANDVKLKKKKTMNKFYFIRRNIGTNPDLSKYYFSTIEELLDQVSLLKSQNESKRHLRWSISKHKNDTQYILMSETKGIEERGTESPLKRNEWFVYGYIYTDETTENIDDLLPTLECDMTNWFIERRYMSSDDFKGLSESDQEKCRRDGGIILNLKSNEEIEEHWKDVCKRVATASEVINQKRI